MSNFKFKAANGSDVSLNEITVRVFPSSNGYAPSDFNYFYPGIGFVSDGTPGQAGITTCNNSYNINGQDILNDGYISSGGGTPQEGNGALGKYVFFEGNSNNNIIPSWCHYIRVLLIGGGGGGADNSCGGAGEFVLKDISAAQISGSSYNITIGNGGSTTSGYGDGGGFTTFGSSGPSGPVVVQAMGGGGAGGVPGSGGGGGGFNSNTSTYVSGQGGHGDAIGGYGAGPSINPFQGWDRHFGFYVGRMEEQVALVKKMVNIQNKNDTYGRGGDANSPGMPGCACVFYFPHQPPAFIPPEW